ncbi:MAG: DUF4402 domain-containing protein [Gemmatimonadaceae bacterium]|jgi:hypothetical protein|nr:DUF4402 domain-containing protein [Gemmatimonadaceae bacterium]
MVRSHVRSLAALARRVLPARARRLVLAGFACVLAPAPTAGLGAQGSPAAITVTGIRNLGFGSLIPGLASAVPPTDPARAAQFDVRGPAAQQVQLQLALPLSLTGPGGALLPVRYGPSAAAYSLTNAPADAIAFDPALPFTLSLPASGRVQVYLGGTAVPAPTMTPGRYAAVITLTAAATGN